MDRHLKATLFSALVFPGAGQFYLRRYLRGVALLLPTLAAAWYFAGSLWTRSQAIAEQILSGALSPNLFVIAERLQQSGSDSAVLDLCAATMLVCWILGMADAWFVGRPPPSLTTPNPPSKGLP